MKKNIPIEIYRGLLILLFAYTATSKFLDYHLFVFQMMRAPIPIMKSMAPVLGWLTPLIEVILTLGLLWAKTQTKAIISSVILLCLFEIYIITMLLSGLDLPCTCGGIISSMSWKEHLIFNGTFIVIGIFSIIQKKHSRFSEPALLASKNPKSFRA
ncbi:MauE/DoxX family redox-associated membrane protein [Mucilaginibacter sp. X5P1]|uniref:MauE/DoxX family redox-associated membrane protein n=1 Tax=Mucilaginibacter sp. X5P1 TaxID=2723088 RepID=UPI00161EB37C|nr:MauE/DoxX family redox-associated membrane protein [Mucilaginibacter sp. X5P1]MBB6137683.1 hypothetical protein [Mucilaginibacter sp. X5P1]